jgi:hypothetical protein
MSAEVLLAAGVSTLAQVYLRSKEFEIFMSGTYYIHATTYVKMGVSPAYMSFWLLMKPLSVVTFLGVRSSNTGESNASVIFLALVITLITEVLTPNSLLSGIDAMNSFFNVVGWLIFLAGISLRLSAAETSDRISRERIIREPRRNIDDRYILQY